jgi:hypothetical protein
MKSFTFITILVLLCFKLVSQINPADSSVQVIGYWDKKEKHSYNITRNKFQVTETDTTSREFYKYKVDIEIVDSSKHSYVIDWNYKDCEIHTDKEYLKKLAGVAGNQKIRIRTDEYGVFQEVVNWKEVRDNIIKASRFLKKENSDIPNIDKVLKQVEDLYRTKESIHAGAIDDIQLYYGFHGARYFLGEDYRSEIKLPNLYGGDPFDTRISIWLDEINSDDSNYIIRMQQSVDSTQITNAAYDYLTKIAKTMKVPAPNHDDRTMMTHESWIGSRIHDSGWVIYCIKTTEVAAPGVKNVEEYVIEIQ